MKRLLASALLLLPYPASLAAQSAQLPATPAPPKAQSQTAIGVLIGLDRLFDSQIPRAEIPESLYEKKSAAFERQRDEDKTGDETKAVRYDSTPEESPYATIWLQWTPAGPRVQLLRDIILPRMDGFWRFGISHSSVRKGGHDNDEDFFWLTPVAVKPTLTHADEMNYASQASSRRLTYIGPNYFSYLQFGQFSGGIYDESESALVRSLDDFAKATPKESDYDYKHDDPGLSLTRILGPSVQPEFARITKEVAPKEEDDTKSSTQASSEREEDPCAGAGFTTSQTNWYLSHKQGRWLALLGLRNAGIGKCSRQTDWRPLSQRLPSALVGNNSISVTWAGIEKAFPGARHAFSSPKGDWLVVLTRNEIHFARLNEGTIGDHVFSAKIPYAIPVTAQWALGNYVGLWDQQVSKLPAPNDDVLFTEEPLHD